MGYYKHGSHLILNAPDSPLGDSVLFFVLEDIWRLYRGCERLRYIIIADICSMMILMMPFSVSERVCHYGGRNIALEAELPFFVLAFSLV